MSIRAICVLKTVTTQMVNNLSLLLFKAPPGIQLAQDPTHAKTGQNVTLPKRHVTGFPVPVVTWRKPAGPLDKDKTAQHSGLQTVSLAEKQDIGFFG